MNFLFATLHVAGANVLRRLRDEDRGATAVEYGLLVGLIAVVIIVAVTALGGTLDGMFDDMNTQLEGPAAPATTATTTT